MNETQKEALKEFRKNVLDVLKPDQGDAFLLKWLRARNFDLKKAEILLRQHIYAWETYELDTICDRFVKPEVAAKYEYTSFLGFTKDGSPIRYVCLGRGDLLGFVSSMCVYMMGHYCNYIIESDKKALQKHNEMTGNNVQDITFIMDMEGMTLQQFAHRPVIETGLDLMRMFQDQYPEIWRTVICINAPFYFDAAYSLFKPILKSNLTEKIRVASKANSPAELLKCIDADVLPMFLGGNRTDSKGDPMCSEFMKFGGPIPPEYHLQNLRPFKESDPEMECRWVGARSVYNHVLVVKEASTKLHVRVRTEGGSISMAVLYRKFDPDSNAYDMPTSDEYLDENDDKSGVVLISPIMKMQSHIAPAEGFGFCKRPGLYIFRLDNTYSWIYSKKVIFSIKLIPPNSQIEKDEEFVKTKVEAEAQIDFSDKIVT